jgi:hypothetical protein
MSSGCYRLRMKCWFVASQFAHGMTVMQGPAHSAYILLLCSSNRVCVSCSKLFLSGTVPHFLCVAVRSVNCVKVCLDFNALLSQSALSVNLKALNHVCSSLIYR